LKANGSSFGGTGRSRSKRLFFQANRSFPFGLSLSKPRQRTQAFAPFDKPVLSEAEGLWAEGFGDLLLNPTAVPERQPAAMRAVPVCLGSGSDLALSGAALAEVGADRQKWNRNKPWGWSRSLY
jgi:hypothetical protein